MHFNMNLILTYNSTDRRGKEISYELLLETTHMKSLIVCIQLAAECFIGFGSYIHWPVYSSLQHPGPCSRASIMWIHWWQINSLGVEFFLHKVQFFIEKLVHLHCFLVNCSPDSLQRCTLKQNYYYNLQHYFE